ncbi:LysM repeat protein [Enterococcus sp. PF1-24]|uniref:aggregation-promoting factor n=1 Tax=unclassified Enterococcus TaxID=2608891 RepID=UPI0024768E05|nr:MULTISPECIES: LysM peptidoglycan-binding domain-containing protein [unclassified Enterococcus]MDH6363811.1 LysM repeat protein [Enterococcus sp. PFB1-1]MDH6401003.1 LysM repeat protein [Enterococcus sp. PF1-24]
MKTIKFLIGTLTLAGVSLWMGTNQAEAATAYKVNSGDTLSSIAERYFDNSIDGINQIAANNQIADVNLIYVGQELLIPAEGEVITTSQPQVNDVVVNVVTNETPAVVEESPVVTTSGSDAEAKEWIAMKESGGSYTAVNGQYYGRYQLTDSYLGGDYSAENQERVADAYVAGRYGSWSAAQDFWLANGWY